ncbi:unnamed protein product [Leuciscus chuanchicus]
MNRTGDKGQSPTCTGKKSDLLPAMRTKLLLRSYRDRTLSKGHRTPYSQSTLYRMPQGTQSSAFSKSTKHIRQCCGSAPQDWRNRCGVRPLSAWLLPACAPEPDGVVLYPDYCPSASSLQIPERAGAQMIPERAEDQMIPERAGAQSPVSGVSMGYGSGESSPDHRRHDELLVSDDDRDETSDVNTQRDSETPADVISACFQTSVSSNRMSGVFLHQPAVKRSVWSVRPLMENTELDRDERCVSPRSHPYISRTPARLHRSASALHPAADGEHSHHPKPQPTTGYKSVFMGIFDHSSRSAFVRSGTDVGREGLALSLTLIHPKAVLSG